MLKLRTNLLLWNISYQDTWAWKGKGLYVAPKEVKFKFHLVTEQNKNKQCKVDLVVLSLK